jgi:hypothetical protein
MEAYAEQTQHTQSREDLLLGDLQYTLDQLYYFLLSDGGTRLG